ncbi:MAG: GatB/YqeY domain-containing protein [Bacteroidales bacterium]|jgi:uncharacterized protein YqeY|nr:GatB/YqeY domain-containing protein [Bacteroidales bacterium]
MSVSQQVAKDLMAAMKNKEKGKLEALRALKTAFTLAKTSSTSELSEDEELKIVQKLVKQRKDSAQEYTTQNRQELADVELHEAEIISQYLPKQLSEKEIAAFVDETIAKTGAEGMKDMGKVMGVVTKELAGKADGKIISDIVKSRLI